MEIALTLVCLFLLVHFLGTSINFLETVQSHLSVPGFDLSTCPDVRNVMTREFGRLSRRRSLSSKCDSTIQSNARLVHAHLDNSVEIKFLRGVFYQNNRQEQGVMAAFMQIKVLNMRLQQLCGIPSADIYACLCGSGTQSGTYAKRDRK